MAKKTEFVVVKVLKVIIVDLFLCASALSNKMTLINQHIMLL